MVSTGFNSPLINHNLDIDSSRAEKYADNYLNNDYWKTASRQQAEKKRQAYLSAIQEDILDDNIVNGSSIFRASKSADSEGVALVAESQVILAERDLEDDGEINGSIINTSLKNGRTKVLSEGAWLNSLFQSKPAAQFGSFSIVNPNLISAYGASSSNQFLSSLPGKSQEDFNTLLRGYINQAKMDYSDDGLINGSAMTKILKNRSGRNSLFDSEEIQIAAASQVTNMVMDIQDDGKINGTVLLNAYKQAY